MKPEHTEERNWARRLSGSLISRIFFGYFLVLGIVAYAALTYFSDAIKPAVRQTMEETMVEEAGLLAELVQARLHEGSASDVVPTDFDAIVRRVSERDLGATIYGVPKRRWDKRVYITDRAGIVRFDSARQDVGSDYSQWNNVKRTLEGRYGARSTRTIEGASVMHVSAALHKEGAVHGVVTVAKRITDMDPFLELARRRLLRTAAVGLSVSLTAGLLISWLLSRSVSRLVAYASLAAEGQRAVPPALEGELGALAQAMEKMRVGLEGKAYVEQAMQTFAHEMKSPLSAIVSAAELLEADLQAEDRMRFASLVQTEAIRMRLLLERLLELAVIERRTMLRDAAPLNLVELIEGAKRLLASRLDDKKLAISLEADETLLVHGEAILLQQALRNLLENGIDFASPHSTLRLKAHRIDDRVILRIHNEGPEIPPFAMVRVFERFYSLPRPDSGRRSQGLGLAFVREVTDLHGGAIDLRNEAIDGRRGVSATWTLRAGG